VLWGRCGLNVTTGPAHRFPCGPLSDEAVRLRGDSCELPHDELGGPPDRWELLAAAAEGALLYEVENGCLWCRAARQLKDGICSDCRALIRSNRAPLSTLNFVACSRTSDALYRRLASWKRGGCYRADALTVYFGGEPGALFAALLSVHLELVWKHAIDGGALLVMAPTRTPVVGRALALARDYGWYAPEIAAVAEHPGGAQKASTSKARKDLRAEHYGSLDRVDGRVVLLDDIYTSGTTMHAFARALRRAGATDVHGVALLRCGSWRHTSGVRLDPRQHWSPDRVLISAFDAYGLARSQLARTDAGWQRRRGVWTDIELGHG
jgi:predicted amidophosphoribosyltransferase